jgi:hypothetical protein
MFVYTETSVEYSFTRKRVLYRVVSQKRPICHSWITRHHILWKSLHRFKRGKNWEEKVVCRYRTVKGGRAVTSVTSPLIKTRELHHISFLSQQNRDKAGIQSDRGRDVLTCTACCLYNETQKFWAQKNSCLIPFKVTNTRNRFMVGAHRLLHATAGHKAVKILHAILFTFATLHVP